MKEWNEYKLGDICSRLRSGKNIKSNVVSNSGKYPVIGGNGVRGYTEESNFRGQAAVIGRQGANCGNVRFFEGEAYMTEHAVVAVGNELADTRYLACLLSLMHLGNLSAQSAQPGISVQTLSKQIVRLPSISYQRKVSLIIKSLDDKIEVNRRINDNFYYQKFLEIVMIWMITSIINDNLEQQAQALFKSWFVDFEPFKNGEFVDSELGRIPKGWSVKELGQVTISQNEKVRERKNVKVLSPVTSGELVLSEEYFTKQVYSENLEKYIVVRPYEFAYNPARVNIGSIGMNTYGFDGCVSPVYVVFRCEEGYQYYFDIFRQTSFFKEEVKTRAIGGVRQILGYKDFSMIKIVYPPKDIIEEFNDIYTKFLLKKYKNNEENKHLASVRDIILPKLMSGELKVSEINM